MLQSALSHASVLALGIVAAGFLRSPNDALDSLVSVSQSLLLRDQRHLNASYITDASPQWINSASPTCQTVAKIFPHNSTLNWPGTGAYKDDVHHWAVSASDESSCSVRPQSTDDLSKLLQLLGWTRTPFAISGGGHALNPGFSSTSGVHISMSNFNYLHWDREKETIDIGAGLRWDHVYDYLNPQGYTVVGGRVRGVGVAGFILGGGLSWTTNQRGLTIDTLVSCQVVLPNGTVVTASDNENQDLFFGLKGGFNNFGVVTQFTLKVYPQTDIWGGTVILAEADMEPAHQAIANFADTVRDPKATLNVIFEYAEGVMYAIIIMFYDAPEPPSGLFDELLALPKGAVSTSTMSFTALLDAGQPRNTPRRIQDLAPVQRFSPAVLAAVANETKYWGAYLEKHHSGHFFDYVVEVFLPDYYSHGKPSAWPADRSIVHFPVNIAFAWFDAQHDRAVHDALRQTVDRIRTVAEEDGQDLTGASLYPNLPIEGTSMERMYGKNLGRLRELRDKFDPSRVMDLTGGWKF